jgi:hypothetical protein
MKVVARWCMQAESFPGKQNVSYNSVVCDGNFIERVLRSVELRIFSCVAFLVWFKTLIRYVNSV